VGGVEFYPSHCGEANRGPHLLSPGALAASYSVVPCTALALHLSKETEREYRITVGRASNALGWLIRAIRG